MTLYPRARPIGDAALTLELGDAIDPALNRSVQSLDRSLAERPFSGFVEAVPTYRSLVVHYDPRRATFAAVHEALLERLTSRDLPQHVGGLRLIPTLYGGEDGPDLAEVARACGLSEADVVALHSGSDYTALMLGFAPGFAYLGMLPEPLETPRRTTPRTRVPAGSVAIAGRQTGIYPSSTPGGWNIVGRTAARVFDVAARPPALILPGDRVRFVPARELPAPPVAGATAAQWTTPRPSLEVLDGGLLTTVQDAGRIGHRRLGIARCGPMDAAAHAAANALAGNPVDAAALECTWVGPTLRFLATTVFVVTGADLGAVLHRSDLGDWRIPLGSRLLARAGNVLGLGTRREGCRAYVAFAGGIDVPVLLGSRATDIAGGFGGLDGRALRSGDMLALGPPPARGAERIPPLAATSVASSSPVTLRVVPGPHEDRLTPDSWELLLESTYAVGQASNRTGCRLEGAQLSHRGAPEVISDGMTFGSVQVSPDGQPIVMMADGPTTGGYPQVATVVTADLPRLAQLAPGEGRVRFQAVTIEQAQA